MKELIRILLVDDDQDDHDFFYQAASEITENDLEIKSAYNGSELLELLFDLRNNNQRLPNLIVLDMNMPMVKGDTLLQTLKSIREFADIPVFILTTSDDEKTKQHCLHLGCTAYYTKSTSISKLKTQIQDMLFRVTERF